MIGQHENEIVRAVFRELESADCIHTGHGYKKFVKDAILRGLQSVEGLHYVGTPICKSAMVGGAGHPDPAIFVGDRNPTVAGGQGILPKQEQVGQ